ncbi:hypothetical protein, partial [Parabacteroides sp. PM5-20]|uniref:hypothetical protein n=1 Tax=Parabacteroides sp. PM5-20 TaxID=2940527 RepID=UPI0024756626
MRTTHSRWRLWCVMLLAVFIGTASSWGQVLDWQPVSADELYRNNLDEGKNLEIYFVAKSAVPGAAIQITLPTGIKTNDPAILNPIGSNDATYGNGVLSSGGTVITIPVTGGLLQDAVVNVQLPIWAACEAAVKDANFDQIKVKVLDASLSTVDDVEKAVDVKVKNPVITGSFENLVGADFVAGVTQSLELSSIGGKTKGLTIKLTADDTFTLAEFKLDGTDLPAITPNNNVYTITLSDEEFTSSVRKLSFKSIHPLMGGSRSIKASVTSTCGQVASVTDQVFVIPGETGIPNMRYQSLSYVKADLMNEEPVFGTGNWAAWDGKLQYAKVTFLNVGDRAVYTKTHFYVRNMLGYFLTGDKVYYKIGSGSLKEVSKATAYEDYPFTWMAIPSSAVGKWKRRVQVVVNDAIAKNETITFYVPYYHGNLNSNAADWTELLKQDYVQTSPEFFLERFTANIIEVKNSSGGDGNMDYKEYYSATFFVPKFFEKPVSLTFNEKDRVGTNPIEKTFELPFNPGTLSSTIKLTGSLHIEAPAWITITDMQIKDEAGGITLNTSKSDISNGKYVYDINLGDETTKSRTIQCKYEVANGALSVNTDGAIRWFLYYGIDATDQKVELPPLSRVTQAVYYRVSPVDVELTSFEVKRDADCIGLEPKTSDALCFEAKFPNEPATSPDHSIYMNDDKGSMIWKAKILTGSITAGSKSLYFPVQNDNFTLLNTNGNLNLSAGTIKVTRGATPIASGAIDFKANSGYKGYIVYPIVNDLQAGDEIEVKIPFTVNVAANRTSHITSEAKIGDNSVDPWANTSSLSGNSIETLSISTYQINLKAYHTNAESYSFNNSTLTQKVSLRLNSNEYTLPSPFFPNEIRSVVYLTKGTITVPKGYTLENIKLYPAARTKHDSWALTPVSLPSSKADLDKDNDVYTVDISKLFGAGGWAYPDDSWCHIIEFDVKASTFSPEGNRNLILDIDGVSPRTSVPYTTSRTLKLSYAGYSVSTVQLSQLLIDDKAQPTDINITVNNSSPSAIKDTWLYLEGSLTIVSAEDKGGNPLIVNGNYIKVASSIDAAKTQDVVVKVQYTGTGSEDVKIHTLSGWAGSLDPTSKTITDTSLDGNRGRVGTITLSLLENRVDGELNVSKTIFKENDTYTLTATVSSEASQGSLKNLVMDIVVPAGQEFQSAVVSYGGNDYQLSDQSVFDPITDGFVFDVRKVLNISGDLEFPGYETKGSANPRTAEIKITYKIGSATLLSGISFLGEVKATGKNAGDVKKSGIVSKEMYPELDLPYGFELSMTPERTAFSDQTKDRELIVKVKLSKLKTGAVLKTTDRLELVLPDYLQVLSTGTFAWDYTGSTLTVSDDAVDAGTKLRTVKLPLATAAYSAVGDEVTYTIPVQYLGGAESATPYKSLVAKAITLGGFSGGTLQDVAAGNTAIDALFVTSDALTMFADETKTLSITSTGVTGSFFDGANWGADASSTDVTPSHVDYDVAAGATVNQKVKVTYGGNIYGEVDLPYTVYPSLIYTLSPTEIPSCGNYTFQVSDITVSKNSNHTDVKFYSDAACSSEITGSHAFTSSGKVYVQASNQGGVEATAKEIVITISQKVEVTIGTSTTLTVGDQLVLTATAVNAPAGALYHWHKGGTKVHETTTNTWTIPSVALTDAGTYTVMVMNSAGNSTGLCDNTSSNAATVSVVAAPPAVTFVGSASDYVFCDAVSGGLTLWDAISSDKSTTGVTYWYAPTAGAGGGLTEVNAGSPCPITSAGSFFVKSKNAADTYSTEEELKVVVNTSVSAGLTAAPTSVVVGDNITLTASGAKTSGSKGTFYQFYKNGTALDAATNTATKTYQATSTDVVSGLSFTVKIVNDASGNTDGLCGALESTAQTVTVTDRPVKVELKKAVETINDCGANATLDLMSLIDNMTDYTHNETFYWSETDNSSTATAFTQTISLSTALAPGTKHDVFVWAKNAYNFSLNSTKIEVYAIKYAPIALGTVSAPDVEEVAGDPATLTVTVTGTTGEKGTGDYTYRLYDAQVGGTLLASNTTGVLTQTVTAPSLTATSSTGYVEYTYYVSAQGICDESIPQEVKVKVYPKATIEANTTDDVEFCTDNTSLSSAKLADYLTDALRTQWFDYTYDVSGAATATNQSLDANTPLPTSEGTYTYTLRATNRLSGSTAATATLTVKIAIPITLSPITTPQNLEGASSISLIANPTAGTPVSFEWYKDAVKQSETSGTLTFNYGHTDVNTAFTTNTYYAKALGAIACADAQTNNVVVNVYPTPTLSLATTTDAYCEDNTALVAGIDLWSYINTPNDVWFTYTYSGNGVTDGALAAGTVTIPTQPGTYTYTIKAVNKLATSTLEATETITIKVDR